MTLYFIGSCIKRTILNTTTAVNSRNITDIARGFSTRLCAPVNKSTSLLVKSTNGPTANIQPSRSRVYFSKEDGLPRSVVAVPERFFRLNNGQWIRTLAGKNKKLWRKTARRKYRSQQHIFVNGQQCRLLDAMVNKEYKRKTHFANDPYEPYHKLERLPMYNFKKAKFLP